MQEYINVIKNYANFKGRARRKEYWMFTLFSFLFTLLAMILDNLLGDTFKDPITGINTYYGYMYLVYGLFVFLPSLAVSVRRLHDVNKSGWFIFIALIPLAGAIWLLVLLCTDSTPGPNKYGPNPKGVGNIDDFDFMNTPVT